MHKSRHHPDAERFRALLRALREERGLKQDQLAELLGRPQSFVSKYESGERRIDYLELREICRALAVPVGEVVRRFEEAAG